MESEGTFKLLSLKSTIFVSVYEFFGTFLALVGVNCAKNNPYVVALGFFISATLTGRVCGGHFNSAITVAVYITEAKWLRNLPIMFLIIFIDLLGAFCAMGLSIAMLGEEGTFKLYPPVRDIGGSFSVIGILFVESLFTWILVSTVLFVKYRKVSSSTDGMLSNLTCAIAVFVCVSMAGPISGAGLNPTFGSALQITDVILHAYYPDQSQKIYPEYLPAYIFGPILGGCMAALMLHLTSYVTPDVVKEEIAELAQLQFMTTEGEIIADENGARRSMAKRKISGTGVVLLTKKDYMM